MKFVCPDCQQPLETETIYAGQAVECPACGKTVAVPPGKESQTPDLTLTMESPREVVQSLWEQTIQQAGGLDDVTMTLKGAKDPAHKKPPRPMPESVKVRPKDIGQKGAGTTVPEYELMRMLGEGGMGMVYEAKQTAIDRTIAIKMIKPEAADEDNCRQFLAEAIATADLDHPNIVPIHDLGMNSEGALFYAMKQVVGTSWKDLITRKSLNENLDILLRVADAVAFAHNRGIIHRDLKPENVMLGDFGEVLLMDWGLAAAVTANAKAEPLDPDHAIGGSPCYMAPEMAIGDAAKIGYGSDIYLLGAILFEIVTGERPHTGTDVMDCLQNAAENQIVDTVESGELVDIARKSMATEPEDRYASVKAFQAAVRDYQQHEESILLVQKAEKHLAEAQSAQRYELFVDAVAGCKQALELWDGNKHAKERLKSARFAYAQCAFNKGDLDLAASLLDTGDKSHSELCKQVEVARKERDARIRRMRVLKVTSAISAAAIVVILSVAWIWINRERSRAEDALVRFEAEQRQRLEERRTSAPALYNSARVMLSQDDFKRAVLLLDLVLEYDASFLPALHLLAVLHIKDNQPAHAASLLAGASKPDDETGHLLEQARLAAQGDEAHHFVLSVWANDENIPALAHHFAQSALNLVEVHKQRINEVWPRARLTMRQDGTLQLECRDRNVTDRSLEILRGMSISELRLDSARKLEDLSPLEGMPLRSLDIGSGRISDLSPLAGLPLLTVLSLHNNQISDLSPLAGLPQLTSLNFSGNRVSDLSPLAGMALKRLTMINNQVTDLSPLAGLHIEILNCGENQISDLSPLAGLPLLTVLSLHNNQISDLSPLAGLPLTFLRIDSNQISDLSPLADLPLRNLCLIDNRISDLSPLAGLPLTGLSCEDNPISDLSPLAGLQLSNLSFTPATVTQGIEVIRNMSTLYLIGTKYRMPNLCRMSAAEFWQKYDAGEFK